MNIAVVGSLGFDYIMNFSGNFTDRIKEEKIHSLSLSFLVDHLSKQLGGTAGNIAYTLKLTGLQPYIVAYAGNDFEPYRKHLASHNIPLDGIKEHKALPTSAYFVITDLDNNQIGSFYVGAMKDAHKLRINALPVKPDFVVIAPTDPKAMVKSAQYCQEHSLPYLFDPAFQTATFKHEELRLAINDAAILIGNDYEINLIESSLDISHEELLLMVPLLITTLGNKGSIIETRKESIHIKPAKTRGVVDPTGAGDAYRAGFLAGYLKKQPLAMCGQMGSVAAAYSVELYGTQTHTFTKQAFNRRYEENYGGKGLL